MDEKREPVAEEASPLGVCEESPITLSAADQQAFFDALTNPPKPNAVLKKLMSGPKLAKWKKS